MSALNALVRAIGLVATLAVLGGCDDDDPDKKAKYEVEILVSEHINWVITEVKQTGRFKKPLIEVHHPGGVEAKRVERDPKKTTVYEFSRLDFAFASGILLSIIGLPLLRRRPPDAVPYLGPGTYQRG